MIKLVKRSIIYKTFEIKDQKSDVTSKDNILWLVIGFLFG